jgi:hypothetical protein
LGAEERGGGKREEQQEGEGSAHVVDPNGVWGYEATPGSGVWQGENGSGEWRKKKESKRSGTERAEKKRQGRTTRAGEW